MPPPSPSADLPGPLPGHVVASGYYGYRNSGDEAILIVLLDQLRRLGVHQSWILTEMPGRIDALYAGQGARGLRDWEMLGFLGFKNLLRGRLFRKIGIQARARLFIYGGGSIFRDVGMSRKNLYRLLDDIFLARLCRVPIFFYALGVGPIESPWARRLLGMAARAADVITVRDEPGAALLRQIGVPEARITVVTDPAFLLPDADPGQAARDAGLEAFLARHPKTLFVYPTMEMVGPPLADGDSLLHETADALSLLCREDGWAVVLLPMEVLTEAEHARGILDDVLVNRRIAAAMDPAAAVHCMEVALPPDQMRALTSLATLNVTARLHAMIYAVSQGIPCVALNYHPKVAGNAARFGLSDRVIDFAPGWQHRMVAEVRRLAVEMPEARAALAARLPALHAAAAETFRQLARLLHGRSPQGRPPA